MYGYYCCDYLISRYIIVLQNLYLCKPVECQIIKDTGVKLHALCDHVYP